MESWPAPFAPGRWLRPALYVLTAVMGLLAILVIAGQSTADPSTTTAAHQAPGSVQIDSRSPLVNSARLQTRLQQLRFAHPADVGVLVRQGAGGGDIEEAARQAARESHPDWLSGDAWRGDRVVIYLNITDPAGHGDSGVYFGPGAFEHGHHSASTMRKAGTQAFEGARWEDGIVAIGTSAAEVSETEEGNAVILVLVTVILGVISAVLALRAHGRRRRFDAALAAAHAAEAQLRETQMRLHGDMMQAARGSEDGGALLRGSDDWDWRLATFSSHLAEVHGLSAGHRRSTVAAAWAATLARESEGLFFARAGLLDVAAVLTSRPGWQEAFSRQCAAMQQEAAAALELAQRGRRVEASATLAAHARDVAQRTERLRQDVMVGRTDGRTGLHALADQALHLAGPAREVGHAMIDRKAGRSPSGGAHDRFENELQAGPAPSRALMVGLFLPASVAWAPVAAHSTATASALAALHRYTYGDHTDGGGGGGGGSSSGSF